MIFDLHTHTNLSTCAGRDNTWEVLLCRAQEAGVKLLSITDHNTTGFYTENKNVEKYFSGKIVPGIEFSVSLDGVAIELLAYNFDMDTRHKWTYEKYGTPKSRQEKIVKALELSEEEVYKEIYDKYSYLGKDELLEIGIISKGARTRIRLLYCFRWQYICP